MINACTKVYDDGVNPYDIKTTDSGYICIGSSTTSTAGPKDGSGYVGRCIDVAVGGSEGTPGAGGCTDITGALNANATHPYYEDGNATNPTSDQWLLCGNDEVMPSGKSGGTKLTTACVAGNVYTCPSGSTWNGGNNSCRDGSNNQLFEIAQSCAAGGTLPTAVDYSWVANHDTLVTGCVELAIRDYCQEYYRQQGILKQHIY